MASDLKRQKAAIKQTNINVQSSEQLRKAIIDFIATGQSQPVNPVFGPTGGMFPSGGTTLQSLAGYEGNLVSGLGPLLERAFGEAEGFGQAPGQRASEASLMSLLGQQPSFQADPALRERYFQQAVTDPALRLYNEQIAPSILARFGPGGAIGAARRELARSGRDLSGDLAGVRATLLREDERLAAQSMDAARAQGLQAVPLLNQTRLQPLSLLTQFGEAGRALTQQQNLERLFRGLLSSPYGDPRLSLLPLAGPNASLAQQGGGGFGAGQILSGLGGLASGGGRLLGAP